MHHRGDARISHKEAPAAVEALGADNVKLLVADEKKGAVLSDYGYEIVSLGPLRNARCARFFLGNWRVLITILRTPKAAGHFHDPELFPALFLLRVLGRTVIYDAHEDFAEQLLSKHWIPELLRKPLSFFARLSVGVFGLVASEVVSATPIIQEKVKKGGVLVRNLPPLEELNPVETDRDDVAFTSMLYVGAISEERGLFVMLDALVQLNQTRETWLDLAGEFVTDSVAQVARAHPGWKFVRYHGFVDRQRLAELCSSCGIGLAILKPLKRYQEAICTKMLEYMGAGLVTIVPDYPVWRELVGDDESLVFLGRPEAEALTQAVGLVLDDLDLARLRGRRGRSVVLSRLNWSSEKGALISTYNRLFRSQG